MRGNETLKASHQLNEAQSAVPTANCEPAVDLEAAAKNFVSRPPQAALGRGTLSPP